MRYMIWPLLLIVLSNCFYNICTKSVPEGVNTFGTLTITYLVGAVLNKRKVTHPFCKLKSARAASDALMVLWYY